MSLDPIDIPRLEALLAAANRTGLYAEADSENEEIAVIDDRGVCLAVFSWLSDARVYVALHNAAPALLAELKALRARVAELETERDGLAFELGKYSRVADNPALYQTINDCLRTDSLIAERDRLRAELTAEGKVRTQLRGELLAAADALEKETKRLEWLMTHGLAYVWRGNPRYSVELTFRNRDELDKAIKKEVSNGTTK